ncbi:MAG: hypothetical protein IEMM0002_0140 [bacterium]|nr:MAG: hypothetical protein IEMM0002_0140 [bacterium]
MLVMYGIAFIVLAVIVMAVGVYLFLSDRKKEKKIRQKPARQTEIAAPRWETNVLGGVDIPPGSPRNLETIKTMTDANPEVVVEVVRVWLRPH